MLARSRLYFTSLPESQRLGKSTGVSLSAGWRINTAWVCLYTKTQWQSRLDCVNAHRPMRESKALSTPAKLKLHVTTSGDFLALPVTVHFCLLSPINQPCRPVRGRRTFWVVMCFSWTVRFSSSSLTHKMAGWRTLLGSRTSTWETQTRNFFVTPHLLICCHTTGFCFFRGSLRWKNKEITDEWNQTNDKTNHGGSILNFK